MQKKLTSQLVALFFCVTACAQIKITNRDALHPDSSLLFIGAENIVTVDGPSADYDLTVKSGTANVSKIEAKMYGVKVYNNQPVILQATSTDKSKPGVHTQQFRNDVIRQYEIRVGSAEDTVLTVAHIIANPSLSVIIPGSRFRHNMSVTSFRFAAISGTDTTFSENLTQGSKLNPLQLDQVKRSLRGDKLYFDEIRAATPDSMIYKFHPLTILLK